MARCMLSALLCSLVVMSASGVSFAGAYRGGRGYLGMIEEPESHKRIRELECADEFLKDPEIVKYLERLFDKSNNFLSVDSPIMSLLSIFSRDCGSAGKLAGFQRISDGKDEHFFFTTNRRVEWGNLILGGQDIGSSCWLTVSPGKPARVLPVGDPGFDLAGASLGGVLRGGTLYSLAPDAVVYALKPKTSGEKTSVDVKPLGVLPLLDVARKSHPEASELALHSMTAWGKRGVEVVVEVKSKDGSYRLLRIPVEWKTIDDLAPVGEKIEPGRVPRLAYLGATRHKGAECLAGFDVRTNQLSLYSLQGKIEKNEPLLAGQDAVVQRLCNTWMFKPRNKGKKYLGEFWATFTFHGPLSPDQLRPIQMRGFYQMHESGGTRWVGYLEMERLSLVVRPWKESGLGKAERVPTKEDVFSYRFVDIGGRPGVCTIEASKRTVNQPTCRYRLYMREKDGWRWVRDWEAEHKYWWTVGGIDNQQKYFDVISTKDGIRIYSVPINAAKVDLHIKITDLKLPAR